MIAPITNALTFLITVAFDLYLLIVMLRLILQIMRANYQNAIAQFVLKATRPVVAPLQRVFPTFKGVDLAIVFFIFALELIKVLLLVLVRGHFPSLLGWFFVALGMGFEVFLDVYFYAILLRVLLGWINPLHLGSLSEILYVMTEPVLRYARGRIPLMGGFDLSPLFVLILIQVLSIVFAGPIIGVGWHLMNR